MDTVLVCDDEKEIVDAIDIYLTREGINVLKAHNGKEALEILEKEDVQLLLIDIMMPEMVYTVLISIILFKPIFGICSKFDEIEKRSSKKFV